jgi:hypothetical protein
LRLLFVLLLLLLLLLPVSLRQPHCRRGWVLLRHGGFVGGCRKSLRQVGVGLRIARTRGSVRSVRVLLACAIRRAIIRNLRINSKGAGRSQQSGAGRCRW